MDVQGGTTVRTGSLKRGQPAILSQGTRKRLRGSVSAVRETHVGNTSIFASTPAPKANYSRRRLDLDLSPIVNDTVRKRVVLTQTRSQEPQGSREEPPRLCRVTEEADEEQGGAAGDSYLSVDQIGPTESEDEENEGPVGRVTRSRSIAPIRVLPGPASQQSLSSSRTQRASRGRRSRNTVAVQNQHGKSETTDSSDGEPKEKLSKSPTAVSSDTDKDAIRNGNDRSRSRQPTELPIPRSHPNPPATLQQAPPPPPAEPDPSQGSQKASQSSFSSQSNRTRQDHRRRSVFALARLPQEPEAQDSDLDRRTTTPRSVRKRRKAAPRTQSSSSSGSARYVGKDVFGNYNMLQVDQFEDILIQEKPDLRLNAQQVEALANRVNLFLEDFFNHYCGQTQQFYGFLPFSELRKALLEQCLVEESTTPYDLVMMMKKSLTREQMLKAEGVLLPSRYSAQLDNDNYLIK